MHASDTGHRALLVEDNPADSDLLLEFLGPLGVRTTVSRNWNQALVSLNENGAFDLVILDINMPMLDGYQVLASLRSEPKLRMIPVLMYSHSHNPDDEARAYEAGADYYIRKPGTLRGMETVVAVIQRMLSPGIVRFTKRECSHDLGTGL